FTHSEQRTGGRGAHAGLLTNIEASKSADIRKRLNHLVIDSDGHMLEVESAIIDQLKNGCGATLTERFQSRVNENLFSSYRLSSADRWDKRPPRSTWLGLPTKNPRHRPTASIPALLYKTLYEHCLAFSGFYPASGLTVPHIPNEKLRPPTSGTYTKSSAETY